MVVFALALCGRRLNLLINGLLLKEQALGWVKAVYGGGQFSEFAGVDEV